MFFHSEKSISDSEKIRDLIGCRKEEGGGRREIVPKKRDYGISERPLNQFFQAV
jgi:hypothetical protein